MSPSQILSLHWYLDLLWSWVPTIIDAEKHAVNFSSDRKSSPLSLRIAERMRICEVRPRSDKRGVDLISDVLPFGRLWYIDVPHAIGYAQFYSRSHDGVIRVYDAAAM
jgi:hypothetical protein